MNYFMSNNVHIALISEPYVGNVTYLRSIQGLKIFQFSCVDRVKACIFIRDDIAASALGKSDLSSSNLAVVDLKLNNKTVTIASIYIEPRDDPFNTIAKLDGLMTVKNTHSVVIGGDLNGNHPLWGSNTTDSRGDDIASLCASHNLYISNIGNTPTFEAVRQGRLLTSIDDLTLVSDSMLPHLRNWTVDRSICPCSDHNAITFSLSEQRPSPHVPRESTRLYNTKKADWSKFHELLSNDTALCNLFEADLSLLTPDLLDEAVATLTSAVQRACNGSMKLKSSRISNKNKWWNTELDDMKKEVIHLHHTLARLKRNGHNLDAALLDYQEAKIKYAKAIRTASTKHFREFCSSQGKDDVWSLTNKLLKNYPPSPASAPSTLSTNNGFTTSSAASAAAILDYYFPNDDDASRHIAATLADTSPLAQSELPFTCEEVLTCMQSFRPQKAPGHDHLTADICLQVIEKHLGFMTDLFNCCLEKGHFPLLWKQATVILIPKPGKPDPTAISSRRPIGLLPVFGKLFEKLFLRRLTYNCLKNELWNSKQFGFRPQTSSVDALQMAVDVIRQKKTSKKQVIAISLDICSAFNNARWPDILKGLKRTSCPQNIFNVITSYFTDRWVSLSFGDAVSSKLMTKGCIQGSVCGPTFWNLIVDELLNLQFQSDVHIQAFADDIFLIVSGKTAAAVEINAAHAINIVSNWGRSNNLTFSADKTQWITFTKKAESISIAMDNQPLVRKNSIKLLGVIIDERLSFFKHIRHAIQKATRVYKAICLYVRPTWGLHSENVEIIYHQVIEPMITYAARIWGLTAARPSAKKSLTSFQRLFAIKAIRGFRTISSTAACALAQFLPLHLKIKEVYEVEQVKSTEKFALLSGDVKLQGRTPVGQQLHPRDRTKVAFPVVSTQAEADSLRASYNIFTDGSKLESGDTGAAVIIEHDVSEDVVIKLKLHKSCSVFQAELFGILKAITWVDANCSDTSVNIYTDSLSSLLALQSYSDHTLVTEIHEKLHGMPLKGISLKFVKVKAHANIQGNEKADECAKASARLHKAAQYKFFPLSYARRIIQQNILDEWQSEYASSATGSTTRQIFPTIKRIQAYRQVVSLSFPTTQFFTGHGYFKSYLHRFKIIDDPLCPCDRSSIQTPQHLLENCPRYASSRFQFESLCSLHNVSAVEAPRATHIPALLFSFSSLCNVIIRSLKAFNEN